MKRNLTVMFSIFAVVLSLQAQSKVERFTLKSAILGVEKTYSVYLPDGYDKSDEKYPVLYLLHGAWGTDRSWVEEERGNLLAEWLKR